MYRILVIEDDRAIADAITAQLAAWDMTAHAVTDFRNILGEFASFEPHLILLDIRLPFYNGYHWCQEIRRVSKVPIIFISSASGSMNIVMAMNMGADDFIAKPFDLNVLLAKVQALLRRTYDFASNVTVLEHHGAMLNTGEGILTYEGETIPLGNGQLRGRKHAVGERESPAQAAGRGGSDGLHRHTARRGVYREVRAI